MCPREPGSGCLRDSPAGARCRQPWQRGSFPEPLSLLFLRPLRDFKFCLAANYLIPSGSRGQALFSHQVQRDHTQIGLHLCSLVTSSQCKIVSTQEGSKPDCQTSLDLGIQASLTQRVFLLLWCFRGGSLKINTVPGLSYPMMRNP